MSTLLPVDFRRPVVYGAPGEHGAEKDEGSWETVSVVGRDRLGA